MKNFIFSSLIIILLCIISIGFVDVQNSDRYNNSVKEEALIQKVDITVGGFVWREYGYDCEYDSNLGSIVYDEKIPNVKIYIKDTVSYIDTIYTDNFGTYRFVVPEGAYYIEIANENFGPGMSLDNLRSCDFSTDPNLDKPNDNNAFSNVNGKITTSLIILSAGDEPAGNTNLTIDMGFTFDCASTSNNPFTHQDCQTAVDNPVCDINLFQSGCATMYDFNNPTGPVLLCNGSAPYNSSWFSFFAGYGDYGLEVELFGCYKSAFGTVGVIAALYEYDPSFDLSCSLNNNPINCHEETDEFSSFIIDCSILIPGNLYLLSFDGLGGSTCGYSFNIVGDYESFIVNEPKVLTCNGQSECGVVCSGSDLTFTVYDDFDTLYNDYGYNISQNLKFYWSIKDSNLAIIKNFISDENLITDANQLTIKLANAGIYYICLDEVLDICNNVVPSDLCMQVEVIAAPNIMPKLSSIMIGDSIVLSSSIKGVWSSNSTNVIHIDQNGLAIAKSLGFATVSLTDTSTQCVDSISLEIINCIDFLPAISQIEDSLVTSTNGSSYIWIDCGTQDSVQNGSDSYYLPETAGMYMVIVDNDTCQFVSDCFSFTTVRVQSTQDFDLMISPNPTTGQVLIKSSSVPNRIDVIGLTGQTMMSVSNTSSINIQHLPAGLYTLVVIIGSRTQFLKVIKV